MDLYSTTHAHSLFATALAVLPVPLLPLLLQSVFKVLPASSKCPSAPVLPPKVLSNLSHPVIHIASISIPYLLPHLWDCAGFDNSSGWAAAVHTRIACYLQGVAGQTGCQTRQVMDKLCLFSISRRVDMTSFLSPTSEFPKVVRI